MNFTLTFSHIVDGKRVPLFIDGIEATLQVEAADRMGAIYHSTTKAFCETHECTVRRIL